MVHVRASVARKRRKKRVLKRAKGQFGHRSRRFSQAVRSVRKGLSYAFRDRKAKKREYKSVWIVRINAACRAEGISYSRFIKGLKEAKVEVNRKLLADMAVNSKDVFKKLVNLASENVSSKK